MGKILNAINSTKVTDNKASCVTIPGLPGKPCDV